MRSLFVLTVLCGCGTAIPDGDLFDSSIDGSSQGDGSADASSDAPKDAAMDSATSDGSTNDAALDAGPGTYAAYGIIGGLDRVRIAKTVGGTCFFIQLVTPSNNGGGLTLPTYWGFEYARAVQPAAACNPAYLGPITNSFDATSQSGTIVFPGFAQIPQTIQSVMATINFANNPMWCPASETFSATNINVQ